MTAAPELAIGDVIAGKYRIESVLGRGGMGAVYLAVNEDLGRRVAIKVLLAQLADDEQLLKRFRQEARTAAAIGHPGIVDVLDLGTTADGSPFIVMEALEGETLGARMTRERRMDIADAVAIIAQALDALAAAHEKDILHRDLKPENLFLVARPVAGVKILDFGISKLGGADGEDVSLTRTGAVFGTPLYMSPEQARSVKHVTAASDLYSVGAILYQMLAGRTPFVGASYNELIANVLNGPTTPLVQLRKDVPAELAALIDRMLAREPAERPQTARQARAELLAASRDVKPGARAAVDAIADTAPPGPSVTVSTEPPPAANLATSISIEAVTTAPPKTPARRAVWLAAGGVLVAGGIVTLVLARGGADHASPTTAAPAADARASQPATAPPDAAPAAPPDAAPPDAGDRTVRKDHPPLPLPSHRDAGVTTPAAPADARPAGMDLDRINPLLDGGH